MDQTRFAAGRRVTGTGVDESRLWADHEALARLTEPERPFTRRSFSPLFSEGRDWLERRFRDAGLKTRIDAGGNLIGRLEGTDAEAGTLMTGSHSDTVPGGGRFDGISGVLAGLEVARCLAGRSRPPRHAFEVVDFLAEEASDCGVSCVGSRAMTGRLDDSLLAQTFPDGRTLARALEAIGGDPGRLAEAQRDDIRAFLELHIEQGPVLEIAGTAIGVVAAIVGITRVEIVFEGKAGHAGTVPMDGRRDALAASAALVGWVKQSATEIAHEVPGHFVATAGVLEVEPNAPNVVPARARLVIDTRSEDKGCVERFVESLRTEAEAAAARQGVRLAVCGLLSESLPVTCDARLQQAIAQAADDLDLSSMRMASGAGHDTSFLARICPAAMVFVPCRDGLSHHADEWAEPAALAAGARVLLATIETIDRDGLG